MTTMIYFTGLAKWAKVYTPDDMYQKYSIDLFLDDESWELFNESGLLLQPKEVAEDQGEPFGTCIRFSRPVSKEIKGALVNFGPPPVLDSEGLPMTDNIGNGSKVTVKVSVYDTRKGMGHRLESIRVDDLVPYENNVDVVGADRIGLAF